MTDKTRVAVLGGGPAALTTAFELTATPELRERFEVTVHQLGWRLGGKGASGRNAAHGQRIEEHGLHIWFGFYDNAFDVMQRCYEELDRPASAPLARWDDAFKPLNDCVQFELYQGEWVPHHFHLPANVLTPGEPVSVGLWEMLHKSFSYLESEWRRILAAPGPVAQTVANAPRPALDESTHRALHDWLEDELGRFERLEAHHVFRVLSKLADHHASHRTPAIHTRVELTVAARLMHAVRDWIWLHVVEKHLDHNELRLLFMWVDLGSAMLNGIVEDLLVERGFGAVNDEEFRHWLRRHGARDLTVDGSPLVRAIYDAAFCYEEGDISRPNVAAGKAAQDFIRSVFLYKGALMYKMQAGMGDVVFGPLYEVLRRRGVRFEFFNCVSGLGVSQDGQDVDTVQLIQQARVRGGYEYQPLVNVLGLPCWPSEPDWNQLDDGDKLKAAGVDFEKYVNPLGNEPIELRRGRDFDAIVLGIPVGALPPICGPLAQANERFAAMLDNSTTVMTQAFQLWLKRTAPELGFPYGSGMLASCYVEPLDTYCDMDQLLVREGWRSTDEVRQIAYFCGVLPHAGLSTQEEADQRAHDGAVEWIRRDAHGIWPRAHAIDGSFDWNCLAGAGDATGEQRFEAQYWRANFSGTERYALTLADSVQYRLRPDDSGFANLFLAGDWTKNGIDGGSVEAAVTSGLMAARAISGDPTPVPGVDGVLESDRGEVRV